MVIAQGGGTPLVVLPTLICFLMKRLHDVIGGYKLLYTRFTSVDVLHFVMRQSVGSVLSHVTRRRCKAQALAKEQLTYVYYLRNLVTSSL